MLKCIPNVSRNQANYRAAKMSLFDVHYALFRVCRQPVHHAGGFLRRLSREMIDGELNYGVIRRDSHEPKMRDMLSRFRRTKVHTSKVSRHFSGRRKIGFRIHTDQFAIEFISHVINIGAYSSL